MNETNLEEMRTLLVDRDGRLRQVALALRQQDAAVTVESVSGTGDLPATVDGEPPGVVVVLEADDVDGIAELEAALDAVDGVPVVAFAIDPATDFVERALAAGAKDVICVGPDPDVSESNPVLAARRIRHAAGLAEPFQTPRELLDSLLGYLPHQIFIKDDKGRIADASRVAAEEYGFTRERLVGLTDFELLPPDLAEELYEEEQAIMATGEPLVNHVEHYVDEEGRDRWVSTTKAARYDEDGDPVGIIGSTRDVTEEKRKEEMINALHEASRGLMQAETKADVSEVSTAIAEDIPALPEVQIALYDGIEEALRPIAGGDEGVRLFEAHEQQFELAYDTGRPRFVGTDEAAAADEDAVEDPVTAVVPLGDHGALGSTVSSGTFDEFVVDMVRILAANVAAALDRAERERELARQNERLEEFTSIVSHDLRSPLSVALGYVEVAQETGDLSHLSEVESALRRMDAMTEDLLTLARNGQVVGETAAVPLSDAARAAWSHVETDGATLSVDTDVTVEADRGRLVEILENLFRNSIDHVGTRVTVRVGGLGGGKRNADDGSRASDDGGGTGFFVADDGPGIEDNEKEEVFTPGYTTADDGTGFGLHIVSTLADAHGWDVRLVDAAGGGARFEFDGVETR